MDEGRRRLLDDLLVAALHGALALREAGHVAVRVGHELDLDVARRRHELLHEQPVVSKRLLGLVRREGEALGDLARVAGHAHALAAAARARFEHDLCRFFLFLSAPPLAWALVYCIIRSRRRRLACL